MHRISAVEFVIFLAMFILASFTIRYTTIMLIKRDPDSRIGQALAVIH